MEVNRRVVETITRERLPFDPSAAKIGRINADSLQAHLNNFKYVQLILLYYCLFCYILQWNLLFCFSPDTDMRFQ